MKQQIDISKLKKKLKQENLFDWLLNITAFMCVLGIIFCILMYTKYAYNSDFSYATNIAREEMRQLRLYPENWRYSTGFYVFSLNLFCMPFLLFLKNEVLCRELAMVVLCFALVFICWKAFRKYSKRMAWTIIILTFLPLQGVIHWYFYDGNYLNFAFMQMLVLALAGKLLFDEELKHQKIYYLLYIALLIIVTNDGLRNQLTITIPIFLAIVYYSYKRTEKQIFEKKYKIFLAATLCGAVLGYGFYRYIQITEGWMGMDASYFFVDAKTMVESIKTLIVNMYSFYGFELTGMLTAQGITSAANWIYGTASIFVVPIFVLKNLNKIKVEFIKFVLLFCTFCNGLTVFIAITTAAAAARILLPIYFNNIIYMGCFVGFLANTVYKKYEELFLICVILIAGVNHLNYNIQQNYDGKLNMTGGTVSAFFHPEDDTGLTQFLEENDLHYGYANYFDGLRVSSFSEGKIRIVPYNEPNPTEWVEWMISTNWYNYEEYPERCFILVAGENPEYEKYYELADEILYYSAAYKQTEFGFRMGNIKYTIFVFNKNINQYPNW